MFSFSQKTLELSSKISHFSSKNLDYQIFPPFFHLCNLNIFYFIIASYTLKTKHYFQIHNNHVDLLKHYDFYSSQLVLIRLLTETISWRCLNQHWMTTGWALSLLPGSFCPDMSSKRLVLSVINGQSPVLTCDSECEPCVRILEGITLMKSTLGWCYCSLETHKKTKAGIRVQTWGVYDLPVTWSP